MSTAGNTHDEEWDRFFWEWMQWWLLVAQMRELLRPEQAPTDNDCQ